MLKFNYLNLKNNAGQPTAINEKVVLSPAFFKRSAAILQQAKNVHVVGELVYLEPFVSGTFHVVADLVVPSSRSLSPVAYNEDFSFAEDYADHEPTKEEADDHEQLIVQIHEGIIDVQRAVEDNLLLHIPTTILTPEEAQNDIYPSGKGWKVVSEAKDKDKPAKGNPAFKKLEALFKNQPDD